MLQDEVTEGALEKAEMLSEEEDWEKLKGNAILVVEEGSVIISRDKDDGQTTKGSSRRNIPRAALLSFDEGPPFTLQRLCEILLAARSIYPKLSKLDLALEKVRI
ncbi:hypothetical protein IGI04_009432 [Brassica rapa subsp. trilocularis]|uniref:Uncharacterized protein n=1 Tax=Brassica rapa subsp. trilocularis TaxID=1813537 RepID=A0ABQ7MXB9_BRACM|nr:hypothetical protein IGI04_009432 [Brassica rapa subsp. trilocularis]